MTESTEPISNQCPACHDKIDPACAVCPHCGLRLKPSVVPIKRPMSHTTIKLIVIAVMAPFVLVIVIMLLAFAICAMG